MGIDKISYIIAINFLILKFIIACNGTMHTQIAKYTKLATVKKATAGQLHTHNLSGGMKSG